MIVVANTKELEEKFDLSRIRDDELIRVEGGLKGKSKYNNNHYISRTTYTAKTLKQIIQQMKKMNIAQMRLPGFLIIRSTAMSGKMILFQNSKI